MTATMPDAVQEIETPASVANEKAIRAPKPDYHVPTMAEVRALTPNGFTVASTFSGCGGSSLGYRMAGFRVAYASEFIEAARDTYRANCEPYTFIDDRDIRRVTGASLMEHAGVEPGELDLLDGSPPCSSFSTAGKREKFWGTVKDYSATTAKGEQGSAQRTDDLFFEFSRILRDVQPKMFVAENVSGLVKGTAKGYFKEILAELKDCGYRVEARLLNAAWLGVPQARQRLIFHGVRNDLGFTPKFPKPFKYQYTVRDALGAEPYAAELKVDHAADRYRIATWPAMFDRTMTDEEFTAHVEAVSHLSEPLRFYDDFDVDPETGWMLSFNKYSIYKSWLNLKLGATPDTAKHFNMTRIDPDKPSPTIAAVWGNYRGMASAAHWDRPRKLTLLECRRLCGFPDDFELRGTFGQRWERMGRAVPPLMMKAIAETARDNLLEHL